LVHLYQIVYIVCMSRIPIKTETAPSPFKTGGIVKFGPYKWRVLRVGGNKALLVAEGLIEEGTYPYSSDRKKATWADCTLRAYLNGAFYNKFSEADKARILETKVTNTDNVWFGTDGGKDTIDKIFLLSVEEVVTYFGDSGQLQMKNPNSKYFINDKYKGARIAKSEGKALWWWLRSPGLSDGIAMYVGAGGSINLSGHRVDDDCGSVRPALWVQEKVV
jgi:hypothetical protein